MIKAALAIARRIHDLIDVFCTTLNPDCRRSRRGHIALQHDRCSYRVYLNSGTAFNWSLVMLVVSTA